MAQLMATVEHRLDTDFAMLSVEQESVAGDGPDCLSFAASAPGVVSMVCGTKYARIVVRLERWDSEPACADARWEDQDELPFAVIDDDPQVSVSGFEPSDGDPLPVEGLSRARVRVHARGRHRYSHGDDVDLDALPPEEWLIQFWPDPHGHDALEGPPRRIAGPLRFETRPSAWQAALGGWRTNGWTRTLGGIVAFDAVQRALSGAGRPVAVADLQERWQRTGRPSLSLDGPVDGGLRRLLQDAQAQAQLLAGLAAAATLSEISTVADLLIALERVGLLGRIGQDRLVPNPSPPACWDVLAMSPADAHSIRVGLAWDQERSMQDDLLHLLRWAPGGRLSAPPVRMAVRLARPVSEVLGALEALRLLGKVTVDTPLDDLDPHESVTIRSGAH